MIVENRKARHEYYIIESVEAGIELYGTEVKSIRNGGANLKESWCDIKNGEIWLKGAHIAPYEKGNIFNRDPLRDKRLLMHRREIQRFYEQVKQAGLTLVPLSLYFKGPRVKVSVGLCRGKKLYDKRASAAQADAKREIERNLKNQR